MARKDDTYNVQAYSLDKVLADVYPPNAPDTNPPLDSLIEARVAVTLANGTPAPEGIDVYFSTAQVSLAAMKYFDVNLAVLTKNIQTEEVATKTDDKGIATVYVGCLFNAIGQLQARCQGSSDSFPTNVVFCTFSVPDTDPSRQKPAPAIPGTGAVKIPFLYDPNTSNTYDIETRPVPGIIGDSSYPMVATYIDSANGGLIEVFELNDGAPLQFGVPYELMNGDDQQDNRLQYLFYTSGSGKLSKRGVFAATGTAVQQPDPGLSSTPNYLNPIYKWDQDPSKDTLEDGDAVNGTFDFLVPFWPGYNPQAPVDLTFSWYVNGFVSGTTTAHAKTLSYTKPTVKVENGPPAWPIDTDYPGNFLIQLSADYVADFAMNRIRQYGQSWIIYTVGNIHPSPSLFYYVNFSSSLFDTEKRKPDRRR